MCFSVGEHANLTDAELAGKRNYKNEIITTIKHSLMNNEPVGPNCWSAVGPRFNSTSVFLSSKVVL